MKAATHYCAVGTASFLIVFAYLTAGVEAQHSPTVANHTNVCFGRASGQERDVANCNQYFICINGQPSLRNCNANNQLYNHERQRCEPNTSAMRSQCFACPNTNAHINLPADYQCQQYVRCFRGVPEQRVCSEGLVFDPVTRNCNFPDRVQCACPVVDRPDQPWFTRSHTNCSLFNICIRGVHVPMSCPPGLHFNRTISQCDTPRERECIRLDEVNNINNTTTVAPPTNPTPTTAPTIAPTTTTLTISPTTSSTTTPTTTSTTTSTTTTTMAPPTTVGPFSCSSSNGINFEPHPTDCTQFYICSSGVATQRPCPNGSLFDAQSLSCVESSAAVCFA